MYRRESTKCGEVFSGGLFSCMHLENSFCILVDFKPVSVANLDIPNSSSPPNVPSFTGPKFVCANSSINIVLLTFVE